MFVTNEDDDIVVLCTHYPPYKTNDPDLWNCKAGNGCIALQSEIVPEYLDIIPYALDNIN